MSTPGVGERDCNPLKEDGMKLMTNPARAKRGWLALIGAALVMGAWTAGPLAAQPRPRPRIPPVPPRATPAPGFSLAPESILANQPAFKAYIRGLAFDTSFRGADRRVLMQTRSPADTMLFVGPKAELAPEVGAAKVVGNWVERGRVLARITLWSSSTYAHLHLHPGVTYLVVQSVRGHPDSLVAFLIGTASDTTATSIDTMAVRVETGSGPARFILSPRDDDICVPCNHKTCCPT
jgi:hypothetical protein